MASDAGASRAHDDRGPGQESAAPAAETGGAGGAHEGGRAADSVETTPFYLEAHARYIAGLSARTDTLEYVVTEHLRMSGVYWGLTAMDVLNRAEDMDRPAIVEWVLKCRAENGGFGGNEGHDPHMLYTLSAVQLLALCGALDRIDKDATAKFVAGLQRADGSFIGDEWGEVDTRFSYCALSCLAILGKLWPAEGDDALIDVKAATDYVASCRNFDGGFGATPGAESHAGQVFCCVGALSIGRALHHVDADLLGWWLAERQVDSGGLNGRPEKQADVCYSWWILSALSILGRVAWIDRGKLVRFILSCQDDESTVDGSEGGGISERPGNMVDVFHTFFGISGLSLLGDLQRRGVDEHPIDPVFALPTWLVAELGLDAQTLPPVAEAPAAAE